MQLLYTPLRKACWPLSKKRTGPFQICLQSNCFRHITVNIKMNFRPLWFWSQENVAVSFSMLPSLYFGHLFFFLVTSEMVFSCIAPSPNLATVPFVWTRCLFYIVNCKDKILLVLNHGGCKSWWTGYWINLDFNPQGFSRCTFGLGIHSAGAVIRWGSWSPCQLGLGFMVMILTPSMGIAKLRVMKKVPALTSAVAGPSDIIFMIGLVFWVILIVGYLMWKIFNSFIMELCPCLAWCTEEDDKKKKTEEEKTTGCLCFWSKHFHPRASRLS